MDIAEEIVAIHDRINETKELLAGLEKKFQDKVLLAVAELNNTSKKLSFDLKGCKLVLNRRDYKSFPVSVQAELNKSKAQFEDEIEVFKNKRSDRDKAIKLKAQKEGNIVLTPKWYAKVER